MAVTVSQLMAAIRQIETGGQKDPYRTVNGIGATGAYQVMPFNIGPWTKEVLGRAMTQAEFRNSREAQDAVARAKLGGYMKRYGSWQAAASVWFSGKPDWNSSASDGGNTVKQYVTKVAAALKKVGAGVTGGTGGAGAPAALPSIGKGVFTAQHAGYEAEPKVGPYGAPTNPFKLAGWIASSGTQGAAAPGGVEQVSSGGEIFGGGSMPWDGVATAVLASLFVVGGLGLVVVGLTAAVSPTVDKATAAASNIHPAAAAATAAKGAVS
ncbi:hypothetical protein ACIPQA_33615 [Streptomyces sp. NPDC090109]|uniref:hypothetical protein n=1 Tax=Streptomyces sp. NPDC090109 TaxID=3365948 RepID=UPI003830EC15